MYKLRRKLFSQNFLHNRQLVSRLVEHSSVGKNDLVLEIGPGRGIITEQLVRRAQHVIAVEIDGHWVETLRNKFRTSTNLTLYCDDFLHFPLPKIPYKVFANPPFAIEGQIVRRLIDGSHPPVDCYLVLMKELAYRLAAPHKENQFSLMHKPWFDFSIYHHFRRQDFTPRSNVDTAVLRFTRLENPLLPFSEKRSYENFIRFSFGYGLPIARNLRPRREQTNLYGTLAKHGISKKTLPNQLSLDQWISLYRGLKYITY